MSVTDDWTRDDTGRSNSSPRFVALCAEVERLIRDDAHLLIAGRAGHTARRVIAHLARRRGLAPTRDVRRAPNLGGDRMDEFLNALLAEIETCTTDAELFRLIHRAWLGYQSGGVGCFDWDFDSRDLMDAIVKRRLVLTSETP